MSWDWIKLDKHLIPNLTFENCVEDLKGVVDYVTKSSDIKRSGDKTFDKVILVGHSAGNFLVKRIKIENNKKITKKYRIIYYYKK